MQAVNRLAKKIIRSYNRLSLHRKFLVTLLGITVIPVLLLQTVSFLSMNSISKQQVMDYTNSQLQQSYGVMDSLFGHYDNLVLELSQDALLVDELKNINNWGPHYQVSMAKIRQQLQDKGLGEAGVLGLAVLTNNNIVIHYDKTTYSNLVSHCFPLGNVEEHPTYRQARNASDIYYSSGLMAGTEAEEGEHILYVSHPIVDFNRLNFSVLGTVLLALDEKSLSASIMDSRPPGTALF